MKMIVIMNMVNHDDNGNNIDNSKKNCNDNDHGKNINKDNGYH